MTSTFIKIPNFSNYLVNEDGEIYSLRREKLLGGTINSKGYVNVRITRDDGQIKTMGVHRLVALAFLPTTEDVSNLVVNHKDGDKKNNNFKNLEWSTYSGNARHAGVNGLTSKCTPIVVYHSGRKEKIYFDAIVDCARWLGCSADKIKLRVKMGLSKMWSEGLIFFKKTQEEEFDRLLIKNQLPTIESGWKKNTVIKFLLTGEVKEFKTLSSLSSYLKKSLTTVADWVNRDGQPLLPGFIQIQDKDKMTEWREIVDVIEDYGESNRTKPVAFWDESGFYTIYLSGIEAAIGESITAARMSYLIQFKGKKCFDKGRYCAYYSEVKHMVRLGSNAKLKLPLTDGNTLRVSDTNRMTEMSTWPS